MERLPANPFFKVASFIVLPPTSPSTSYRMTDLFRNGILPRYYAVLVRSATEVVTKRGRVRRKAHSPDPVVGEETSLDCWERWSSSNRYDGRRSGCDDGPNCYCVYEWSWSGSSRPRPVWCSRRQRWSRTSIPWTMQEGRTKRFSCCSSAPTGRLI